MGDVSHFEATPARLKLGAGPQFVAKPVQLEMHYVGIFARCRAVDFGEVSNRLAVGVAHVQS